MPLFTLFSLSLSLFISLSLSFFISICPSGSLYLCPSHSLLYVFLLPSFCLTVFISFYLFPSPSLSLSYFFFPSFVFSFCKIQSMITVYSVTAIQLWLANNTRIQIVKRDRFIGYFVYNFTTPKTVEPTCGANLYLIWMAHYKAKLLKFILGNHQKCSILYH